MLTTMVCFILMKALKMVSPEGLKVFGNWQTIYEGLSQLPKHVQKELVCI
jgi:hypothetical protein